MVLAPEPGTPADLNDLVLAAIRKKRDKGGAAYAAGKTLVVFVEGNGREWYANRVARKLPAPLHFTDVWAVGLNVVDNGCYVYYVAALDLSEGDAPVYRLSIREDFTDWTVERVQ